MSKPYGGIEVGITGSSELAARLRDVAARLPAIAHEALIAEAEAVLPMLQTLAPVGGADNRDKHIGLLRESAVVDPGTTDLVVGILMGGEDVPYALAQESKHYQHPHGGEEHYFSDALRAEQPLFLRRMGQHLASVFGEGGS